MVGLASILIRGGNLVLQRKGLTKLKNSVGGVISPFGTELKGGFRISPYHQLGLKE